MIGQQRRPSIASSPPISQREIANDCDMPVRPCTSRISAAQTLLIAIPGQQQARRRQLAAARAAPITTTRTTPAPANAPAQMPATPATVCQSNAMAMTAPSDAPVDTPSVYGVARASRSIDWKRLPASASAPPANRPSSVRDSRRLDRIDQSGSWRCQTRLQSRALGPTNGNRTAAARKSAADTASQPATADASAASSVAHPRPPAARVEASAARRTPAANGIGDGRGRGQVARHAPVRQNDQPRAEGQRQVEVVGDGDARGAAVGLLSQQR